MAQSFDVADELRRASQAPGRLDLAARAFARDVLARVSPTFYRARQRVFVSYRRADGEGLAADLDRALSAHHEHVFRDLIDIQTGEPAQDRIEDALSRADVLVFIDTPLAGESDWVARELAAAMGRNIPIVWVRTGLEAERLPLAVEPGPRPDLTLDAEGEPGRLALQVLEVALARVAQHVRASVAAFERLRRWASSTGADLQTLDQRMLIYGISLDPTDASYPSRRRTNIIQLYARWPSDEDRAGLESWLTDHGYLGHPTGCRAFDAAVLLRPCAGPVERDRDWSAVDSADHFVSYLEGRPTDEDSSGLRTLLLLGSFASEPSTHQETISAVGDIARRWLETGGRLVFGGHPTFTPLVLEAARLVRLRPDQQRVVMYQSAYYVGPSYVEAIGSQASVVVVRAEATLDESLSVMRRQMIEESCAGLAVIIGGRTSEAGGHTPGIDEELRLALALQMPVFVVGAPGGHAARIAERYRSSPDGWRPLANNLSNGLNEWVATTDDYVGIADLMWRQAAR
jgi:SLOG cluster2/TIR domain